MAELITLPRATVQQALEALENGSPDQYPEDAGVFYDAKDALRAALEQPEQQPELRKLLISAAAMAVAAERKGAYQGASWVADAVLEQPEQEPEQEPVDAEAALRFARADSVAFQYLREQVARQMAGVHNALGSGAGPVLSAAIAKTEKQP
jgi:hypothetical protein